MSTAQITRSPIPLTAAVAAFVAALAFTGVALAEHNNGSDAPATHTSTTYPVYSIERPWHSGVQPGMP